MNIKGSEHVFISGFTGSGKTYLSIQYLKNSLKHVFIFDTKNDLDDFAIFENSYYFTSINDLFKINFKKIKIPSLFIYQPDIHEVNNPEIHDKFFKFCYDKKNCTILVDEVTSVCKNVFTLPFYYMSILSRGRSRNTNVWSLSQRPAQIPPLILTESTHMFSFHLNNKNDRKRLFDQTGIQDFLTQPDTEIPYAFHYFNNKLNQYSKGVIT
jgi:hypothetical protein